MNIFASQSNAHLSVIGTELKQIRNGKVIRDFSSNMYFSVLSQYLNFHPLVSIMKNDEILYSCTFTTATRLLPLNSGYTLDTEKCEHFLYYYTYEKTKES